MKRTALIVAALILLITGCAHAPLERTIGPCYGSINFGAGMHGCLYDIDQDKKPDIVLVYVFNGEEMVLVTSFTNEELDKLMKDGGEL